jgi:polypeptide N-acetylgalactosaminyltransferase
MYTSLMYTRVFQQLSPEEKKVYDQGFLDNAFNQYASDMISLHRTLPATVDEE